MLRPVPQGGTTAAGAGTGAAVGEALVTGGAVVAAAGSVLLLCFTVKAVVDGEQTPIEIADKFYGTHFGDVPGWIQGRYLPKGSATPNTLEIEILIHQAPDGTVSVETSAPTPQPESVSSSRALPSGRPDAESARESKKKRGRLYVTYRKLNRKTNLYYAGRTSMVVDLGLPLRLQAEWAIQFRDMNHHIDENGDPKDASFAQAQLDVFDLGAAIDYDQRHDDPAYWRIRGREQQLIDFGGGAQSDTGKPHRTENVVRAVAKDNPRGRRFHDAATIRWGELHLYTGYQDMRPTHKPGSFLRIPLPDGSFGYGRVLELHFDAFYNYRTTEPDADLDRIASKPILFTIVVRHPYPKSWELVGWREIEERLTQPVVQFNMEVGPLRRCWIFDSLGNEREASPQECIGLEPAAVWESHGVEERLLDAFMGRPNDSLVRMWKELE